MLFGDWGSPSDHLKKFQGTKRRKEGKMKEWRDKSRGSSNSKREEGGKERGDRLEREGGGVRCAG
jgi:hypothetical protein